MPKEKETIEEVVKHGLCTGCGTCAGICPNSAIRMRIDERKGIYIPELIHSKCNQCGICFSTCPGHSVDLSNLNLEIFGKQPTSILLGNYTNCYLAHATDRDVRHNSASGGLITSLLIFALEQGLIDGALVTRMKKDSTLEPEPFIAKTKAEILQASSSKYCPVAANIALSEILKKDGKYAVVGLPCHIYGIRKAEAVSKTLMERITLHFGIFCSHTASFRGTQFLLRNLGIRNKEVAQISYRGRGWPGGVTIKLKNGDERFIPIHDPLWDNISSSFFFTPCRCVLCNDVTAEMSDISFGDAWLAEIMATEHEGKSVIISRSEQGEALLRAASSSGGIEISAIDAKDIIRSQKTFLHFKKVNLEARVRLWQLLGRESPSGRHRTKTSLYNRLVALLPFVNSFMGSKLGFVSLLKHVPTKLLRLYVLAFYRLYSGVVKRDASKLVPGDKRLNILILHAHWNNRGDEAAIRAMIDSLRTEIPFAKMRIMLAAKRVDWFPYDDIERFALYPFPRAKLAHLDVVFNVLTFGKLSLTKSGREFLRAVNEADIVIHAPGGPSIGDLYGSQLLGDLMYLYRLLVAKVLKKKPLFFYAPSMGPFSKRLKNLVRRFILKRADAIILREEISLGYLEDQLGLEACVTSDSAFQNDVSEDGVGKYDKLSETLELIKGKRTVGMVITDLKWHPVYRDSKRLAERIMTCCSDVTRFLLAKGYSILLIPQLFTGEDEYIRLSETQILEKIHEVNKERIHVCPLNIDSYGQQIIISKLFCLISMRYHPTIFAVKGNIPFISICYEHKAEGFAKRTGFADFAIHVEDISATGIINRFTALEQNYDTVKERITAINPSLKAQSRKTTKIIMDKLRQLGWRIDETNE